MYSQSVTFMNNNVRKGVAGRYECIVGACGMRVLGLFVHRFPLNAFTRLLTAFPARASMHSLDIFSHFPFHIMDLFP
jgi:hypothetical protein